MSPQSVVLLVALLLPGVWSCAPDAVTSRQATGYNAFLGQIARECRPLQVGRYPMSEMIQRNCAQPGLRLAEGHASPTVTPRRRSRLADG